MCKTGLKISTFKERLNILCSSSTLTATELAQRLKISKQTLSAWKSGDRSPKEPTIIAIAQYFNVSVEWLMGFDVPKGNAPHIFPDNILSMPDAVKLPLIGEIACGEPILADENIEDWVDVPSNAHGDFLLRCKGDSMKDARILNGDLVCIRKQDDVQDGQIAAVLIDDEATLKRVYHIPGGSLMLQAANSAYKPIICGGSGESRTVRIIGRATYFISSVI